MEWGHRQIPPTPTGRGEALGRRGGNERINNLNIPLSKKYFKLLQALHHSEILDQSILTGSCPVGMKKQVNKLASFIKPSSPSLNTTEKVKLNTQRWLEGNLEILRVHYDEVMGAILGDLPVLDEKALQVAVGWSKLRYKRKFTNTSVDTLRTMLIAPGEISSSPTPPSLDSGCFPPLPVAEGAMGQTPYIQGTLAPRKQRSNLSRSRPPTGSQGHPVLDPLGQSSVAQLSPQDIPIRGNKYLPGGEGGMTPGSSRRSTVVEVHNVRQSVIGSITSTTKTTPLTYREALLTPRENGTVLEGSPLNPISFDLRMEDSSSDEEAAQGPPWGDTEMEVEGSNLHPPTVNGAVAFTTDRDRKSVV